MDNVTHSLAGALIAEAVILLEARRSGAPLPASFRRAALLVSLLANNLPDADLLYTSITPAPLGYLLHHRGHTHTLPIALVLGVLCALSVLGVLRWRWTVTGTQARALGLLGILGPFAHILMDGGNVYGVHPFWPVHDGWFFGDSIFILEPLFWVTALPVLIAQGRSPAWRVVLGGLLVLGVTLPWLLPAFVPLGIRLLIAATALASAFLAWRTSPLTRLAAGAGAWLAIALVFIGMGISARRTLRASMLSAFPDDRLYDLALSPLPANPFCWTAIAVSRDAQDHLVLRRATVAPTPALLSSGGCPQFGMVGSAPTSPIAEPDHPWLRWEDQFRAPVGQLKRLAAERCEVRALLRFARVPYWSSGRGDGTTVIGDLRFDRSERLDFADMAMGPESDGCPPHVPSWVPPRADLFR